MYQPEINPESNLTRRLVADGAFRAAPLRVIDAGARHGAAEFWELYGDQVEVVAFEPDVDECRRLTQNDHSPGRRYIPSGLGATDAEMTLNVASLQESSSLLPNNEPLLARFAIGDRLAHVDAATVHVTAVDTFAEREGLSYVDFMKIDVEGAELLVLQGAEGMLSTSVLGVSVEVWFQEEHLGRPLFADIDRYLREFGFALFDLRNVTRWRRRTDATSELTSAVGSGQLMYGDALFFKDLPGISEPATRVDLLKLASLAELFCYPDFAIEVLQMDSSLALDSNGEASQLVKALRRQTAPGQERWKVTTRRAVRRAIPPTTRRRLMRLVQSLVSE
jgi:FkbM family methyltransferase